MGTQEPRAGGVKKQPAGSIDLRELTAPAPILGTGHCGYRVGLSTFHALEELRVSTGKGYLSDRSQEIALGPLSYFVGPDEINSQFYCLSCGVLKFSSLPLTGFRRWVI